MVHLKKITISYFKNYSLQSFQFGDSRVIGICGPNGTGKTNLLDAVYLSCITKSYFNSNDLVNFDSPVEGFRIEADFTRNGEPTKVINVQRESGKRELILNGVPLVKRANIIGKLPVVMVAPDDIELINGTGEIRRKMIDTIISQTDPVYLEQLTRYNKLVQQRNSLLKQLSDSGNSTEISTLLDVTDMQLVAPACYIHQKRTECTQLFIAACEKNYHLISGENEIISIQYQSQLNEQNITQLLKERAVKDKMLMRTTGGIHRDDLLLQMGGHPFKSIASQGQKKTMLFALKLAEFEILKQALQLSPLLLLDDVFEKLDGNRMNNLLETVYHSHQAQVVITDTHRERLEKMFTELSLQGNILSLNFEV